MKKIHIALLVLILFSFQAADYRSYYNIPLAAASVCAVDYDLDGDLDMVISHYRLSQTHWGGFYFMQNDGEGHFSYMDSVYDSAASRSLYADYVVSEIYPDIVQRSNDSIDILSYDGENYNKLNFYIGPNVNSFTIGDIDNNGHIDIAFIANLDHKWGIIYNMGNNSFSEPYYYELDFPPQDITCDDLNNDGRDDVIIGGYTQVFISTQEGFESQQLPTNSSIVKISDLNNDGYNDIITYEGAAWRGYICIYKNLGNNIFDTIESIEVNRGFDGLFIEDFNNDGLQDLLFSRWVNPVGYHLYYNEGDFQMSEPQIIDTSNYAGGRRNMYCADLDDNSYVDIITCRQNMGANSATSVLDILFNDGQGNFVENPISFSHELVDNSQASINGYPNPFQNEICFEFTSNKNSKIVISIYNTNGKCIKEIIPNKNINKIIWDGRNDKNQNCNSGIYFASLRINSITKQTCKIVKY